MRSMMLRIGLALCAAFISQSALAQVRLGKNLSAEITAAVDKAVEAEMTKQRVVGVAIGIIQDGEIVYLNGYGLADREKKIPMSTESVVNWASNSKPLAAVAAMQLVEKKMLDLDADVRKYVPEFPDKGEVITTRQLLCHQSGIPHYSNGPVIPTKRQYSTALPFLDPVASLDRFNLSPLLYKPGSKSTYSSYAYILLSAVVQRAGQQPFPDQIRDRIAKPLSLQSLQLDITAKSEPNWTVGYVKKAEQIVPAAPTEEYWKHGAGGYKSNIADFARWAQGLINHKLVSRETETLMWTAQKTTRGDAKTTGLGFVVEDQNGLKVSHNGKQSKATSRMVIYPKARHGVVILCNCDFASPAAFSSAIYSALK